MKSTVVDNRNIRYPNYDLMGIVMMLFILIGHVLLYCGKLNQIGTADYYISNFIRSFVMGGVNVFILRSGYFSIVFHKDKIIAFDIRTCFYTWIGFALAVASGVHQLSVVKDVVYLFPIITKQYWFITVYIALCILSPFINYVLEKMSRDMLRKFLVTGFIMFYLLATFCFLINAHQLVEDAGYGLINFVFLYCAGYYIRNYYEDKHRWTFYLFAYSVSSVLLFAVNLFMTHVLGFYYNALISYNTVFTLISSISIFCFFKNLDIDSNGLIRQLSKKTFAVYIIHMNPLLSEWLFQKVFQVESYSKGTMIFACMWIPVVIYLLCYCIDSCADIILKPIENITIRNCDKLIQIFRCRG